MGQRRSIYLLTTILLLVPSVTFGGDPPTTPPDKASTAGNTDNLLDMSLDDLMNVTVTTTSKTEEKLSEAAGVISVMSHDELNRFGARNLKDILMRMPSFNLSTIYMTDRSTLAIRGDQLSPAANHILLLINGRPVREAEEGGIKSEMLESFPVASIDRIEVIRGPGSVLYGSNAFSGVINVITKKASENNTSLTVAGGIPGSVHGTGSAEYNIGDLGIVIGGQFEKSKNWDVTFQAKDTVFRNFSIPDKGFGTYAELSFKGLKYMVSYDRWQNYFAMQKYIPANRSNPLAPPPYYGRHMYGNVLWDKLFNDLGYSLKLSDIWDMTFNATYTQSWLDVDSFPAPVRNSFDLTGEWTNFIRPVKNLNIVLGFLGNRVQGTQHSGLPSVKTLDTSQNTFSGYLQADYRIIPQLKVIAGLQSNKAAGFDFDLNPRFSLIWSPDEIVNVKALYSSAFRAPTIQELYLKSGTIVGTKTLNPEKVQTVDLGVNIQTEKISFGINNFYSEISNSIYQEQRKPPTPNLYSNSKVPTTIIGLEVEGKYYITKELMLTGSGLYQKNTTGDSAGNMMPVPEASAKGGISYSKCGFTASIFNTYEGRLDKRYNATYNKTRKAFDLLDLTLKYELDKAFSWKIPQFAIFIDAYNLLDEEIWLPATGQAKNYTLPQIEGRSINFGIDVGF